MGDTGPGPLSKGLTDLEFSQICGGAKWQFSCGAMGNWFILVTNKNLVMQVQLSWEL